MIIVFGLLGFATGFATGGLTMTAMHGLAHIDLRNGNVPPTVGMYGWMHLAHHRDIPHEVPCAPEALRPTLRQHFRIGGEGWQDLAWVLDNLRTHERWEAIRLLTAYRTLLVGGLCALVGARARNTAVFAAGYAVGVTALMIAYDLEHRWTHTDGPLVSPLHAAHHGNQRRDFGMWDWNNWPLSKGDWLFRFTLEDVRRAEVLAVTLRPSLGAAWAVACAEAKRLYHRACGQE